MYAALCHVVHAELNLWTPAWPHLSSLPALLIGLHRPVNDCLPKGMSLQPEVSKPGGKTQSAAFFLKAKEVGVLSKKDLGVLAVGDGPINCRWTHSMYESPAHALVKAIHDYNQLIKSDSVKWPGWFQRLQASVGRWRSVKELSPEDAEQVLAGNKVVEVSE